MKVLNRLLNRLGARFNKYMSPDVILLIIKQMFDVAETEDEIKFVERLLKYYHTNPQSAIKYLIHDSLWLDINTEFKNKMDEKV